MAKKAAKTTTGARNTERKRTTNERSPRSVSSSPREVTPATSGETPKGGSKNPTTLIGRNERVGCAMPSTR